MLKTFFPMGFCLGLGLVAAVIAGMALHDFAHWIAKAVAG